MIHTVTLNPSLDYRLTLPSLAPGEVNRAQAAALSFGGKGINVSVVLRRLGIESRALGFLGGFCGREIAARLEREGCRGDFLFLEGQNSRINVKLQADGETEINAPGPRLGEGELQRLYRQLDRLLREGDILVLGGSAPGGTKNDVYGEILHLLQGRGILSVVDAERDLLLPALSYRPLLIKPNLSELCEITGERPKTLLQIAACARRLQQSGAQNVLVSLGGRGALLQSGEGPCLYAPAPKGESRGATGAGDSMVAGFLAGLHQGPRHALALGVAAGSATAFGGGLASRGQIDRLLGQVRVEALSEEIPEK